MASIMSARAANGCENNMFNRKAIIVKFLTTLLLAIIIFAPACYLSAKLFRVSTQAKDNYVDFMQELNTFAKEEPLGGKKSLVLIMDTATAIVYFEKEKKEVLVQVDAEAPYTDYSIHIQKPSQCDDAKNCVCLFRKAEFDTTLWKPGYDTVTVIPGRVICTDVEYELEIETCNIGEPESVNSYTCSDGFMIERHLADGSTWATSSYYTNPRRTTLYLTKLEGAVRIAST
ncbi:MAG TPA: hypothetical protein VJI32_07160 [Candidatus Nanoarchaeia archaeon]|nr:hypothetical protein [Candidatus Nanoarchaeia archaeon]